MRQSGWFAVSCCCAGVLAGLPVVHAADRGWYLGADAVQLTTTIDYGSTETYTTRHARFKAGYEALDFLSVEGRVMTAGHDTDIDFLGGLYRFDTGPIFGIYARPRTNFGNANVYGILGLTAMNTKYRGVNPAGPTDSSFVLLPTVGVGGTFRIAGGLFFDVEAQAYVGTADYNNYFFDYVDVYGIGVSAGLRYQF